MSDKEIKQLMCQRLKEERINNGETLEQIGKLLGMSKTNYRKYEVGMLKRVDQKIIEKLANHYGVSPAYLMGFDVPRAIESSEHRIIKNEIVNKLIDMSLDDLVKLNSFIDTFMNKK